jgi:hypothetical protein
VHWSALHTGSEFHFCKFGTVGHIRTNKPGADSPA